MHDKDIYRCIDWLIAIDMYLGFDDSESAERVETDEMPTCDCGKRARRVRETGSATHECE